jgi:hypothetical protein
MDGLSSRGVKIQWVGGRYTMGRRVNISWLGGHNTMGQGNQNTMGMWVNMPWAGEIKTPLVSGSSYHG